ncbi:MAG: polyphosphate kinase 2 family protein [Nocardioidaceae bacterium]|nr:polyphosphate kinase 2 family protein [Nocardioidaceae bacterium]
MADMTDSIAARLRLPLGAVDLQSIDPHDTPGFDGGKATGKRALAALGPTLAEVQERLYAESRAGGTRRILVVLQGMDTSGKGGVVRHSLAALDPQGVQLASFKAPTKQELRHDFLWRINPHLPTAGMIGVFDRSHYEDVLIARVRALAKVAEIERRYDAINDFEKALVDDDVTVVKCMLHISNEEQKARLRARLDNPDKHWKFNPGDIDERAKWDSYQEAYERALERCNTSAAPWYVVPSDRKWYRNWAIATLLLEHLQLLAPQWPIADFDVEQQKVRLAGS